MATKKKTRLILKPSPNQQLLRQAVKHISDKNLSELRKPAKNASMMIRMTKQDKADIKATAMELGINQTEYMTQVHRLVSKELKKAKKTKRE